jgi:hypothetical protein
MDLTIHVHHHIEFDERRSPLTEVLAALGEIKSVLLTSFAKETRMNADVEARLATLTTNVANLTAVDTSAKALIDGFSAQLQAAIDAAKASGVDAAELASFDDLNAALSAKTAELAASVAANTPAAPTPDPTPAPPADTGTGGTATGGTDTGATPPTTDPTGGAGGDGTVPTPVVDDGSTPTS